AQGHEQRDAFGAGDVSESTHVERDCIAGAGINHLRINAALTGDSAKGAARSIRCGFDHFKHPF
ncbi:MAG TPA: hypothetical protein VLI90_10510, partial [Tepidisphaeraceae bacterium]|nr:hypothetical protein [Tepidisphaeraceae bacterium]